MFIVIAIRLLTA